jgi:formylmethanofuran dehydrogenase subunit E
MIEVAESGTVLRFSPKDLMLYHGPSSPGGVALGYKVLERALAELRDRGPVERREVSIRTSFAGPGSRDAFEMVTRAVTGGRFELDGDLARRELGPTREAFVFQVSYRGRTVELALRDGFVTDEFILLARKHTRSPDEEARLTVLKADLATRVLSRKAEDVYDLEPA